MNLESFLESDTTSMIEDYLSEKQKKRKAQRRRLWWLFAVVVIFGVVLFAVWIIERSPVFHIDRFVVTGNQAVASGDVVTLLQASMSRHRTVLLSLLGMDNMLVWPKSLAMSDIALVPQLADVTLEKNYTDHTLTATVSERVPFAIWCEMPAADANGNPSGDESCFWFDKTGRLFERAFDTEGSEIFAVHDYSRRGLAIGGNVLPDIFMPDMLSIMDAARASGVIVKEIALNDLSLQEVDVSIYNGPSIYFSLRFSAEEELPVLQQLMAKPNFSSLQYIDFRTENRAYYK